MTEPAALDLAALAAALERIEAMLDEGVLDESGDVDDLRLILAAAREVLK